ncbi:MAG: adenylate kinase [Candidatus Saccharimonadales bacterium]|jgi:adenylate kinase
MIVLMGVAGAGKSVQGRRVADELALPWLSTGEFLRMLVTGQRRREMLSGKLLDDSEMIGLADRIFHMIDTSEEFILDGFPRTAPQAEWLIAQHKAGLINITNVLHIKANEEVVIERLLDRGRHDDTKESIAERFREYGAVTLPIISSFEDHGIPVHDINGELAPDDVFKQIIPLLEK